MANQMIALGIRGPQLPDLGATSARMSNIMANTAVAREKQAGVARANAFRQLVSSPEFNAANPEHIKAAQALDPEGAAQIAGAFDKRNIDRVKYVSDFFETSLMVLSKAQNPQQLKMAAGILDRNFPDFKEVVGRTVQDIMSDPSGFDAGRNKALFRAQKAAEQVPYLMPKAKAELGYGLKGEMQNVVTGGAPGVAGVFPLEQFDLDTSAPRGGTVTVEPSVTVEPGVGGPMGIPESTAPMMPGAKSPRLSASMANSLANLKSDADYKLAVEAIRRADPAAAEELLRIMPVFDPAKAEGIREAGLAEFEVIPQGTQPGLVAGERGGMGGPYIPTGRQAYGKNPMQSPVPGVYSVPTNIVREKAAAERPSATETYAKKRAEEQAASDVKFLDTVGSAKDQARNVLSVIDQMIGDLNVQDGKIVKGERPPHPGFESVVGAGIPGLRFFPGTQSADFDAFMEQVEGGAFLDAYESLKGTGQITEKEGEKATSAITRMKRSSSEVGFVKAAREFADIVRRGLERAEAREARLRGKTPTAKSSGGKRLRYNPATGEVE